MNLKIAEMPQKPQTFLRYIHNFRGLAILLIVIGHLIPLIQLTNYPMLNSFISAITFNGSVYFVFIAGFLFQFLSKKYKYSFYLQKKLINVVFPYLFVSIPAIGYCLFKNRTFYQDTSVSDAFATWSIWQKITILYATGAHFSHFWFMPMIILFYLFAPVFIWLDRHPKFYKFLPLLLCLSIVVSRAHDHSLILKNFVHFISVYVLGMFCCHYKDAVLIFMKKYWLGWLMFAMGLIALEVILQSTSSPLIDMIYLNTTSKSILSIVLMYFLWRLDLWFPAGIHTVLAKLADLSFGIYFVHGYILFFIYTLAPKWLNLPKSTSAGIIFFTFSLLIVMLLSVITLLIFKRFCGRRSRYLIGC